VEIKATEKVKRAEQVASYQVKKAKFTTDLAFYFYPFT